MNCIRNAQVPTELNGGSPNILPQSLTEHFGYNPGLYVKHEFMPTGSVAALLLGMVMLIAPVGMVTAGLGLGILATGIIWARRILQGHKRKGINRPDSLFYRFASSTDAKLADETRTAQRQG
jgi:hypothetical protein